MRRGTGKNIEQYIEIRISQLKEDMDKALQSVHEEVLVEPEDSNTNQDDQPVDDDLINGYQVLTGKQLNSLLETAYKQLKRSKK